MTGYGEPAITHSDDDERSLVASIALGMWLAFGRIQLSLYDNSRAENLFAAPIEELP